mgnify:CR=1 FL=1
MPNNINLIKIEIGFDNAKNLIPVAYWNLTDGCRECFNPDNKKLRNLIEKFATDFIILCNGKENTDVKQ